MKIKKQVRGEQRRKLLSGRTEGRKQIQTPVQARGDNVWAKESGGGTTRGGGGGLGRLLEQVLQEDEKRRINAWTPNDVVSSLS